MSKINQGRMSHLLELHSQVMSVNAWFAGQEEVGGYEGVRLETVREEHGQS